MKVHLAIFIVKSSQMGQRAKIAPAKGGNEESGGKEEMSPSLVDSFTGRKLKLNVSLV